MVKIGLSFPFEYYFLLPVGGTVAVTKCGDISDFLQKAISLLKFGVDLIMYG